METKKLELEMDGNTTALMECLRDNPGNYCCKPVYYHDDLRCIVSTKSEREIQSHLDVYPIDTWFDYKGMKRVHITCKWFLFYIDGIYYFADFA